MNHHLSLTTALGIFRRMPEYTSVDLDALGVTKDDMQLVNGKLVWRIDQLDTVLKVLYGLMYGTCTILRIPKITIPAEFVAPLIASIVGPANQMLACIWLSQEKQTGTGAMELSARATTQQRMGPVTADQLFALVCEIMATDGAERYRERYAAAMGYAIAQAEDAELEQPAERKRR